MTQSFDQILKSLRDGVLLYSPILMYLFLKRKEYGYQEQIISDTSFDWEDGIYGLPINRWPQQEQNNFLKLFANDEKLYVLQREFIYFLIYLFSGYAFKYIPVEEQSRMRNVLDCLFDLFSYRNEPWFVTPPDQDAYSKYQNAENPLLLLSSEIRKITGEEDSMFLFQFIAEITSISTHFIKPSVEKLFNN